MNKQLIFIPLLLLPALFLPLEAAGEELLTERDAVRIALENSPALEAAMAETFAADARSKQAGGNYMPQVDLIQMYSGTNNPAEAFASQLNQGRFDMDEFFMSDPNNPDWLNTWTTRLQLIQPIYTGGELSSRVDQASLMAEAQHLKEGRTKNMVAFDTLTTFTNVTKAREYVDLIRKSRETTAAHVDLAEQYAETGFIVEAEVLKARVYLAQMEDMVQQAENGAGLAEAALNFHMGIDQATNHELAPLSIDLDTGGTLDQWTTLAFDRRSDLAASRKQVEAGRLEEKAARSGFLPEVALIGHYGIYDDTIFGTNGDSGSVMVNATLNLFKGGSDKQQLTAARHQTAAHEANINRFEEGIRLEVREAWQNLETARARTATAGAALESASEALRITEQRFQQGLDKMIDLLDAETALRGAELRELVARYDVAFATYQLHYASGVSLVDPFSDTEEDQ